MDFMDLKESILYTLDRRRSELDEELQGLKYACYDEIDRSYRNGYIDGYKDGYLALLGDLENLVKYDQLD